MRERFGREMERLVGAPGQYRYLLAVSGGADSCVMALLFRQAGLDFAIAHCNFHLRGADSDRDMELVRALAQQWEVPLFIEEFDTLALQQGSGLSVEMMARQLRYDWFAKIGKDFDYIVTAHHANDAAETVLLNLCRGTGLKGLTAIPERNGNIIRPLLAFTAREIRESANTPPPTSCPTLWTAPTRMSISLATAYAITSFPNWSRSTRPCWTLLPKTEPYSKNNIIFTKNI